MGTAIADKTIFFSWKVVVLNLKLTVRFIKFNLDPNLTFYHSAEASTKQKCIYELDHGICQSQLFIF